VEHHLALRQVCFEEGGLVVRATTVEELRLACKELSLLKRELRSQRRVSLAKATDDIRYLRLSTPAKHKTYLSVMKEVARAPVDALDAQMRAVEAAENQVAAAILARRST
jgi:hypothetical protein